MKILKQTADWEAELATQLRSLRLRQNLDQRELAARAGVALNVVKHLESGQGATVKSLIKVLRTLGRADWIQALAPVVSISPLQLAANKRVRLRASRKRGGGAHVPAR